MNKKIFTLLVGAIMIVGSAFTVNAQTLPLPYTPKVANDDVNFRDLLTADPVDKLIPGYGKFNYLLSVTGVANPLNQGSTYPTIVDFADGLNESSQWVLFIDDVDTVFWRNDEINAKRYLRIEQLAKLDTCYDFRWRHDMDDTNPWWSHKFGALRRAFWCLSYFQNGVGGANVIYDFTNMETGIDLQAPLWNSTHWATNATDGSSEYSGLINQYDPTAVVGGWHFSQTYLSTQNLQKERPLYSYISKDTVLVLVLKSEDLYVNVNDELAKTGGWAVGVKKVAINDLIYNSAGDVRTSSNPSSSGKWVDNVLLFSVKKANRYVFNAYDWNSLAPDNISFSIEPDRTVTNSVNGNIYKTILKDVSTDIPIARLHAHEVNDDLYHYGYMQFEATRGNTNTQSLNRYLYVDTAWVNFGNNQYLAFAWSPRRDNSALAQTNAMGWGGSFTSSLPGTCTVGATGGVLDNIPYMAACGKWTGSAVYWRLDSIIWAWVDEVATQAGRDITDYIYANGAIYNNTGAPGEFELTVAKANLWNEIMQEAENIANYYGTAFTAAYFDDFSFMPALTYNILPFQTQVAGGLTFDGSTFRIRQFGSPPPAQIFMQDPDNVYCNPGINVPRGNYLEQRRVGLLYAADVEAYTYTYLKDSIMENQSKFRVVYDPTYDSTFINVYQSRVRYPNYYPDIQNHTWPAWWENSFGVKDYETFTDQLLRPSDLFTGYFYDGTPNGGVPPRTIEEAAAFYYENVKPLLTYADVPVSPAPWGGWQVEGHGVGTASGERLTGHGGTSVFNFHSFMEFYPQSSFPGMDRVMISTADTCPIYYEAYDVTTYTMNEYRALSHYYGFSLSKNGTSKYYKDSLFYLDIQDNVAGQPKILTLNEAYKNGEHKLNTQIKLKFGPRCEELLPPGPPEPIVFDPDLYLIRNTDGQYLSVPISSVSDSIYWVTPSNNEDLTKMPSYQWAVEPLDENVPNVYKITNREYKNVIIAWCRVSATGNVVWTFNNKGNPNAQVLSKFTPKNTALQQNDSRYDATNFVRRLENVWAKNEWSFLRLGETVKKDQTIGYKYIDKDSTYIDVYAFKYLHFMAVTNPVYLSWEGFRKENNQIYANGREYYDRMYFNLQEMEKEDIGAGNFHELSYANTRPGASKQLYRTFWDTNMLGKKRLYYTENALETVIMEDFGYWTPDIDSLKPLVRQAYRMLLQDYFRWHPSMKGYYVTVGDPSNYVLTDSEIAKEKKYVYGSGKIDGLFGIPHFYFRETFFDILDEKGNDYFAIVQRLDTLRFRDRGHTTSYADIEDYFKYYLYGSTVGKRILDQIKKNNETALAVLDINDEEGKAKFVFRGDAQLGPNVSTFQLERDEDPIYRRIHVNEPDPWFPELKDSPDILEFHIGNQGVVGQRLFENAGDYLNPNNQNSIFDDYMGRRYNLINDEAGKYQRDSLKLNTVNGQKVGNVISFLGINNNAQCPTTNYAFYVDTAYINRGTGWIKPQYMLAVNPLSPMDSLLESEEGDCGVSNDKISIGRPYKIGRYLFNASQYAKAVKDSIQNPDLTFYKSDQVYPTGTGTTTGVWWRKDNFNKVEPIKTTVLRNPNGAAYVQDGTTLWDRFAFSWAIHRGDSLIILKGIAPGVENLADIENIPNEEFSRVVWNQLVDDYGIRSNGYGFVDFNHLIDSNKVNLTGYTEMYWPYGDRGTGALRTYHTYKSMDQVLAAGKKIGIQAIINLADNTHKDWVFSFRYIARHSSDFVIESETTNRDIRSAAIIRPGYGGWMKVDNAVPTITRSDERTLMAEAGGSWMNVVRSTNPVGNEEVNAASTAATVIGGTGTVTILNAAGKKVTISNMLGQTIANATLSSDDATFNAPAGVIVVTIEGDVATKVLVK